MLDPHTMQLERTLPSGAEEWFCPVCGRRFLMQWPPAYSKVVLDAGDEYAVHSGARGGLRVEVPPVASRYDAPPSDELRPWLRWLRDAGLAG